jgi:hypothetical protein
VQHARKSRLAARAAVALAACGPTPQNAADTSNTATAASASASDPTPSTATAISPTPTSTPTTEPWRYGPTLAAAVPPGLSASPVLELAEGLRGRGRFVVAVAGVDAPARLELWTFSQFNAHDRLERVGPPELLLDLGQLEAGIGMPAELVAGLRRDIASPGNETVRVLGLPGEPAAVLAELARLAAAATGPGEPASRARALAEFTRGLDERLMWERLPGLLLRLRAGPWSVGEPTPLGARRVRFSARDGDRSVTLELTRMQERWVLSAVEEG